MEVVFLISAISEEKKILALLKFWRKSGSESSLVSLSHFRVGMVFQSPWYLPEDLEKAVPGPCHHSQDIISHPQAADTVDLSS
jgi:hypothetical protein